MLSLSANTATAIGTLRKIGQQIPYGIADGLNQLALEAQGDTETNLVSQKFTIRTPWYRHGQKYGFNIKFAKKGDIEARMGSAADWLKLQEEGGTKKPQSSSNISLPTEKIRPSKTDVLRKAQRPRALLESENGFFIKSKRFNQTFLARRIDDDINQNGVRFGGLEFLYGLKKTAQIKPRFDFIPTETALVERRYSVVMMEAMARAMGRI